MAKARRQWSNKPGVAISIGALVLAAASGLLAALFALRVFDSLEGGPQARWPGTIVLAVLVILLVWVALLPTWSLTVGRRGIGIRRLGRTRFVDHGSLVGIDLDPSKALRGLRVRTRSGAITILPPIQDAAGFASHAESLARQAGAAGDRSGRQA